MSLTEEQITAKNFEEYHKRILPFLNGSFPTPIVNQFSKGDLYSTDEKIIGQWIDGKPVYQKTIVLSTALTVSTNWTTTPVSTSNMDSFIGISNVLTDDGTNWQCVNAAKDNFILLQNTRTSANVPVKCFTIRYTKTTDSPISIGDGNDYSTDEQVVGTWIDGKPVYQKTVEFTQTLPAGNATTVAHGITNLDVPTCFIVNGSLHTTGGNVVPFPTISSLTASLVGVQSITASALNVSVGSNYTGDWTINGGVFTLQYTKTTD